MFHNGVSFPGQGLSKKTRTKTCMCKRLEGLPFKTVYSHELTDFRIDSGSPVTNVGINFAGPLTVTGNKLNAICACLCVLLRWQFTLK